MSRATVADLLAQKGRRQLTKLRIGSLDDAAAAEAAGIDMLSCPPELILQPGFRAVCPTPFVVGGLEPGRFVTEEDYLRIAFTLIGAGADAVYCGASLRIVRCLRDEGIPVVGHVGLIPSRRTWTGGFRAVGKTAAQAADVLAATLALEAAGAFAAEIEVVPAPVAAAIAVRTGMLMISMGAGPGCDAQYLFACDVLGEHRGHYPRHAKVYRDFARDYNWLQEERVAAFRDYARDVETGAFPEAGHLVTMPEAELAAFLSALPPKG